MNRSVLSRFAPVALVAALCAAPAATELIAGPVPGVETFTKFDVEFDVPPSLEIWSIGGDEYLVTFTYTPEEPLDNTPHIVGDFNSWDRNDLPMEGPDEEGTYRVTARINDGQYNYKIFVQPDSWITDPNNPDRTQDGYQNSILRLGLSALLRDTKAEPGDAQMLTEAFEHNAEDLTYFDLFSESDATIRFRSVRNDLDGARIHFVFQDGSREPKDMYFAAADSMFDFYEYHFHSGSWDKVPIAYTFEAIDGGESSADMPLFPLILDTSKMMKTPEWARHAIWYQIMVDRFRDGDPMNNPEYTENRVSDVTHPWTSEWYEAQPWEEEGDRTFWQWAMYERLYGGDFKGVQEKLDYLKDLGVTAIYFNPVFEASNSHKYNARSFVHADDGYGVAGSYEKSIETHDPLDMETWEFNASDKVLLELIDEIHKRDMKVIFDGVFNHVGDDHPTFLDVRENGQDSRYADWYHILSWDPFEYSGWGGFGGLPEFRKSANDIASESLKEHIFNVTRRWMDPNGDGDPSDGIDGWRLDVPMHLPFGFWEQWVALVKDINPEAYIVGEVWDPAEEWLQPGRFDAVMNYQVPEAAFPFFSNVNNKITASEFDDRLARLRLRYPRNSTYVLQNLFDSHDTDRWVSRIANPDLGYDAQNRLQDNGPNYMDDRPGPEHYQRLRLMAIFQSTYVGAPMIWYGTEVGMFGADDPMCRMPMWWEDMEPYDSPDYFVDADLREHFRSLFHIRHDHEVLRTGDYLTAVTDDAKDTFGFYRYAPDADEVLLVVLNNSGKTQTIDLANPPADVLPRGFHNPNVLFGEPRMDDAQRNSMTLTLAPVSGTVVRFAR